MTGTPGGLSGRASAFSSGRDPGVPRLSVTWGSLYGACFSLFLHFCFSLCVSWIKIFKNVKKKAISLLSIFIFFFKIHLQKFCKHLFLSFWEREREYAAGRDREREKLKQTQHWAWSPARAWSHNLEQKLSRMLNWLHPPGTPLFKIFRNNLR